MSSRRRVKQVFYEDYKDEYPYSSDESDDTEPVSRNSRCDSTAKGTPLNVRVCNPNISHGLLSSNIKKVSSGAKKGINPKHDFKPTDANRPNLNLMIAGHVDAGKSTLMGHLLVKVGAISIQLINKFKKDAAEIGKSSFFYAWVLDEGDEERERGLTVDVTVKHFKTSRKNVTIFDSPGHNDFIPNMLTAAMQADVALLVVDATSCKDSSLKQLGKKHIQIIKALEISHLIVAINKMDLLDFDEMAYDGIVERINSFLSSEAISFDLSNVTYVPVSAFEGVNIEPEDSVFREIVGKWKNKKRLSIISAIDSIEISRVSQEDSPFVAYVSDVINESSSSVTVSIKIDSGSVSESDSVTMLPGPGKARIKEIICRGKRVGACYAGDYAEKVHMEAKMENLRIGTVLVTPTVTENSLVTDSRFWCTTRVLDPRSILVKGNQLISFVHCSMQPVTITRIIREKDFKEFVTLPAGKVALILFTSPFPVCFKCVSQDAKVTSKMSRVLFLDRDVPIAVGEIAAPKAVPAAY